MGAHIFTGAEAKALRDAIRHGGEPCPPDCSGECVAAYAGALMRLRDAAPDLAESVVHHAARAERAEAERDAAIKRATNAERMRDAFVATSVAFAVDMIDKPDAMARCAAERDAAVAQAEELTRALRVAQGDRDEARRLLAMAARGELPRCNECERAMTQRWTDAPGGVCDACAARASADDAAALEDLPHAAALRALVPTEAPRG